MVGAYLATGQAETIRAVEKRTVHGRAVFLRELFQDESTVEFLEALASRHNLSFFISNSANQPLSEARPVGALTATEAETLALVRQGGGEVTSSKVAALAGIEPNAAVNRVSSLVRKGYLHRVSRPRSEGDVSLIYCRLRNERPAWTLLLQQSSPYRKQSVRVFSSLRRCRELSQQTY